MNDAELRDWWPEIGCIVITLRHMGAGEVADALVEALHTGSSSSEILGAIAELLHRHRRLRRRLDAGADAAWSAVLADVYRAFPGSRFKFWLRRLGGS